MYLSMSKLEQRILDLEGRVHDLEVENDILSRTVYDYAKLFSQIKENKKLITSQKSGLDNIDTLNCDDCMQNLDEEECF